MNTDASALSDTVDKPNASNSHRCQHFTSTGRRCRSAAKDSRSRFCPAHDLLEEKRHNGDRSSALLDDTEDAFDSAGGINSSLGKLYTLLVKDKISPRRAAVLAYISSLHLRSLPAMEHENPPRLILDIPRPTRPGSDPNPGATSGSGSVASPSAATPANPRNGHSASESSVTPNPVAPSATGGEGPAVCSPRESRATDHAPRDTDHVPPPAPSGAPTATPPTFRRSFPHRRSRRFPAAAPSRRTRRPRL